MNLRKSKALKFFAVLLFSLEMIAPALISSVEAEPGYDNNQSALTSATGHLTNFIASLLFEENAGEEEERESKDKHTIFIDLDFDLAFIELRTTQSRQISWVEEHQRTTTRPPLFTLLHTYLI
jgi:hypothetical protein